MSRYVQQRPTPVKYNQPAKFHSDYVLSGTTEDVDYVPQTHLRIWYNNEKGSYDNHHHEVMEIIVCMENQMIVQADGKDFTLNVGDIIMIPPHMLHNLVFPEFGVRFIFLINMSVLKCYNDFKTLDLVFMNPFYCSKQTHPYIYNDVYNSLMEMIDIYFENNTFWELRIYSILLQVMTLIAQNHFNETIASDNSTSAAKSWEYFDRFSSLLNFIDANYAQDLTLEQAADYMGFSKFHFSRLFKTYTKTTFYNYLCHKRIQVAQSLLISNIPITTIAAQTGFNNSTTFCRCFKKITNYSPTEYRNRLRKEKTKEKGT